MDDDSQKILIFGLLGSICGVGTYFVNRKLQTLRENQRDLKEQGATHTPLSIYQHKERFMMSGPESKPKFGIINGVLMKHHNLSSATSQLEHKDDLNKIHRHKKLYISEF